MNGIVNKKYLESLSTTEQDLIHADVYGLIDKVQAQFSSSFHDKFPWQELTDILQEKELWQIYELLIAECFQKFLSTWSEFRHSTEFKDLYLKSDFNWKISNNKVDIQFTLNPCLTKKLDYIQKKLRNPGDKMSMYFYLNDSYILHKSFYAEYLKKWEKDNFAWSWIDYTNNQRLRNMRAKYINNKFKTIVLLIEKLIAEIENIKKNANASWYIELPWDTSCESSKIFLMYHYHKNEDEDEDEIKDKIEVWILESNTYYNNSAKEKHDFWTATLWQLTILLYNYQQKNKNTQ